MSISWCVGTWIGLERSMPGTHGWIILFAVLAATALFVRRNRFRSGILVVLACATLGGARASSFVNSVPGEIIPLLGIADGRIVGVQGRIASVENRSPKSTGLLERYGRKDTSGRLAVDELVVTSPDGDEHRLDQSIPVIVENVGESGLPFETGQLIRFRGRLHRSQEPAVSGVRTTRRSEVWMEVPDIQLMRCVGESRGSWVSDSVDLVDAWRLATHDALENALNCFGDARSRELVMAIVLGVRQDDFNRLSLPYRRTGLAHYLAVSGFAFGVLVAMPRFMTSGRNEFLKTASVILVVVFGLCAVDVRSPALRAGLIAATTALGIGLKREWNRSSLLGLTCITLLAIQPTELLNPGFQLSFIVVASLLVLTPVLRGRFTHEHQGGMVKMIRSWFMQACICGIIAWVCATPLVIHHFGVVSTAGVIMSVLAAPLVAVIVITAVVAIILALFSTTLSLPAGALSAGSAWVLDRSASLVSDVPGTCFVMPMTSVTWMICAEFVAWRWFLQRWRWERPVLVIATILLFIAPFISGTTGLDPGGIRVRMLDVGDGTCHVVTGPGGTTLMDGGSSSVRSCASRVILPSLRELGVGSIDGIIITHANLDHFSAVGDLFGRIPVRKVLVGRSFIARAREDPEGAASELIQLAEIWSIPMQVVSSGDRVTCGGLSWRFLHPDDDRSWTKENDRSLVTRVEQIGSDPDDQASILFTGDIEESAMTRLLERKKDLLRARILEVPHHGSVRPSTERFIECVDPEIILQSTGSRRLLKDELGSVIGARFRACTAESGSITVKTWEGLITELLDVRGEPLLQVTSSDEYGEANQ